MKQHHLKVVGNNETNIKKVMNKELNGISDKDVERCQLDLLEQKFYLIKDGKKEVKEIFELGINTFAWDDGYSYKSRLKDNPDQSDEIRYIVNLDT